MLLITVSLSAVSVVSIFIASKDSSASPLVTFCPGISPWRRVLNHSGGSALALTKFPASNTVFDYNGNHFFVNFSGEGGQSHCLFYLIASD